MVDISGPKIQSKLVAYSLGPCHIFHCVFFFSFVNLIMNWWWIKVLIWVCFLSITLRWVWAPWASARIRFLLIHLRWFFVLFHDLWLIWLLFAINLAFITCFLPNIFIIIFGHQSIIVWFIQLLVKILSIKSSGALLFKILFSWFSFGSLRASIFCPELLFIQLRSLFIIFNLIQIVIIQCKHET